MFVYALPVGLLALSVAVGVDVTASKCIFRLRSFAKGAVRLLRRLAARTTALCGLPCRDAPGGTGPILGILFQVDYVDHKYMLILGNPKMKFVVLHCIREIPHGSVGDRDIVVVARCHSVSLGATQNDGTLASDFASLEVAPHRHSIFVASSSLKPFAQRAENHVQTDTE
jgi:hypothetical protein